MDEQTSDQLVELYGEVCRALTDYEHPEETEETSEQLVKDMYTTLVHVQNFMAGNLLN